MGVVKLISVSIESGLSCQLHNRFKEAWVVDGSSFVSQCQHSIRQSHRTTLIILILLICCILFTTIISASVFSTTIIITIMIKVIFGILISIIIHILLLFISHLSKDARLKDARLSTILEHAIEKNPNVVSIEEVKLLCRPHHTLTGVPVRVHQHHSSMCRLYLRHSKVKLWFW